MVRLYILIGSAACLLFVYAAAHGMAIIDFDGVSSSKPTGGAAHFHK
jgi:hypothetical protein